MLEAAILALRTADPGLEEPAATRDRLRSCFAPGATRRMTQLGLLVGALLPEFEPQLDDPIVYASGYGESRALEAYLESFPEASPTLFQTSIHPSGVQQGLIGRQRAVRELYPLSGDAHLPAHALRVALLATAPRVLFCGGEERGTWLRERGVASERTFAFALHLARTAGPAGTDTPPGPCLGRVALRPVTGVEGALSLAAWFDLLHERRPFHGAVAPGYVLELSWS